MTTTPFTIRLSNGTKWTIEMPGEVSSISVEDVKEHLLTLKEEKEYLQDVSSIDRMRLIFKGRILDDERLLTDYAIAPNATLFLVKTGGGASTAKTSPATSSASNAPPNPPTTLTTEAPSLGGTAPSTASTTPATPPSNPFALSGGMGNSNPMNAFSNPQQQPQQNPMMGGASSMLQNPMIQSMLDSNPEFFRNLLQQQMESNPQLRAMMDRNPQLRHMMQDPAALDQALNMMRNPSAMQQALRQQDLQLSQLESMPGGMAALTSMYEQFQAPLDDMENNSQESSATPSNAPTNTGAGASGQAMPNPWGTPRSTSNSNNSSTPTMPNLSPNSGSSSNGSSNPWASMMNGAGGSGGGNPLASMMGDAGGSDGSNPFASMMGAGGGMDPSALMGGGPPSREQRNAVLQMLENPAMQSSLQTMIRSNPEMFRQQLLRSNPMAAQLFEQNPAMLDQMMESMTNPETLRTMFAMQDQMEGMSGGSSSNNSGGMDFSSLLGNGGGGGGNMPDFAALMGNANSNGGGGMPNYSRFLSGMQASASSQQSQQSPAERYAVQLRSLYDMGFDDEQRNLQALEQVQGNVNRAVDYLLTMPMPPAPAPSEESNQDKTD